MSFGTISGGFPCTIMSLDPLAWKLASRSCKLSSRKLNLFVPTLHVYKVSPHVVQRSIKLHFQLLPPLTCHCQQTRGQTQKQGTSACSSSVPPTRQDYHAREVPAHGHRLSNQGVTAQQGRCNNRRGLQCHRAVPTLRYKSRTFILDRLQDLRHTQPTQRIRSTPDPRLCLFASSCAVHDSDCTETINESYALHSTCAHVNPVQCLIFIKQRWSLCF